MITRRRALTAGAIALGVIALITIPLGVHEAGGFAGWLVAVRSDDEDRGWDRLNPSIQDAYGTRHAYLADVAAADWEALVLEGPVDVWEDDGFVRVEATLLSQPATVPLFLFERRIVHARCDEAGRPVGIGVYEDRRPFAGSRFDGGGVTGSQQRCQDAFRGINPDPPEPKDDRPPDS